MMDKTAEGKKGAQLCQIDSEWNVIPNRGKSRSEGVEAGKPRRPGEPRVAQSGAGNRLTGKMMGRETRKGRSERQRALYAKLKTEDSLHKAAESHGSSLR